MKNLLSLVAGFSLFIASCGFLGDDAGHVDVLKSNAAIILDDHHKWRTERPRKHTVQYLDENNLPAKLRELGYKGAAVEEGLVILFTSDYDAPELEAVAVIMDDKDRAAIWAEYGWRNSNDPRIKYLKGAKMLSSATEYSSEISPSVKR